MIIFYLHIRAKKNVVSFISIVYRLSRSNAPLCIGISRLSSWIFIPTPTTTSARLTCRFRGDLNAPRLRFSSNFLSVKTGNSCSDVMQILSSKKRRGVKPQPSGGPARILWGTAVVKWSGCHLASGNTSGRRRGAV